MWGVSLFVLHVIQMLANNEKALVLKKRMYGAEVNCVTRPHTFTTQYKQLTTITTRALLWRRPAVRWCKPAMPWQWTTWQVGIW